LSKLLTIACENDAMNQSLKILVVEDDEALRDALARADNALYEAKASGRDRLVEM